MDAAASFRIIHVRTPQHMAGVRAIRRQVFIVEQGIPAELEWDARDAHCIHLLAAAPDGEFIGTGRLDTDGRIGRMAVLATWRGRGAGTALLDALLQTARERGCRRVYLHAQTSAQALYRRAGFRPLGEVFHEAGIRHVGMEMWLEERDT